MSKCAISQIVQTSQHFVIRMYLEYLLEAAQTSLKFGVAAQNNSKMLLFRPPASVISIPLNTGTCGCISLITFGISGCKQIAPSKGSHLYPSDNAKRQFDVMSGKSFLHLYWTTLHVIIGGWVGQNITSLWRFALSLAYGRLPLLYGLYIAQNSKVQSDTMYYNFCLHYYLHPKRHWLQKR